MTEPRVHALASAIVLISGILWGIYWLPVRALGTMGWPGPWGTAAITLAATLVLLPFAGGLRGAPRLATAATALGGAAFALYSIGFVYGRVAMIILLWFLTPVWSALVGRSLMGWSTPRLRLVAIGFGLAGLAAMLGADGGLPLPRGAGEWMALVAGFVWAFASTGIRISAPLPAGAAGFTFALGAAAASALLAPLMAPLPDAGAFSAQGLGLALVTGALWWGLATAALMWATARLEPARVGILLMTEVPVGALSAALIAGEALSRVEMLGGALVLVAGVLEVWPAKRRG